MDTARALRDGSFEKRQKKNLFLSLLKAQLTSRKKHMAWLGTWMLLASICVMWWILQRHGTEAIYAFAILFAMCLCDGLAYARESYQKAKMELLAAVDDPAILAMWAKERRQAEQVRLQQAAQIPRALQSPMAL